MTYRDQFISEASRLHTKGEIKKFLKAVDAEWGPNAVNNLRCNFVVELVDGSLFAYSDMSGKGRFYPL